MTRHQIFEVLKFSFRSGESFKKFRIVVAGREYSGLVITGNEGREFGGFVGGKDAVGLFCGTFDDEGNTLVESATEVAALTGISGTEAAARIAVEMSGGWRQFPA